MALGLQLAGEGLAMADDERKGDSMEFNYDRDTRSFYRNRRVAREYHETFAQPTGWEGLRFRFIAARERRVVAKLLARVPHGTVLDIPTGTGKMAQVFAEAESNVTACDVSPAMLEIAEKTYEELGHEEVSFSVVDLEEAARVLDATFDVTVCVRLMHRVPAQVKRNMLRQIAALSRFAIVTFAVENSYHNLRRSVRRFFFGGEDVGLDTRPSRGELEQLIQQSHRIVERRPVARGLSAEWAYALQAGR